MTEFEKVLAEIQYGKRAYNEAERIYIINAAGLLEKTLRQQIASEIDADAMESEFRHGVSSFGSVYRQGIEDAKRIVLEGTGNIHDNPEPVVTPASVTDVMDRETLLPGEFRIKGLFKNGTSCQPDVVYVARWLTKMDGPGKKGKIRIWEAGSYIEDGKRYGTYSDWDKAVLTNYEAVPEATISGKQIH